MTEIPRGEELTDELLREFKREMNQVISPLGLEEDPERERRELELAKVAKLQQLAEEQGLKQSSERLGIWLPRDQEEKAGSIPSEFYVTWYNQQGEIMFKKHELNLPIENLAQLAKSVEALGVLYKVSPTYDDVRDNYDGLMKFVYRLAEPKQPEV